MNNELQLTKANRLKLAQAFRRNKHVDYAVDCVVEGQMGKAFVDDLSAPTAFRITVGPFWYLAGDPKTLAARQLVEALPAYALLMPSATGWLELAHDVFGRHLRPFARYSFSPSKLSRQHLEGLLGQSPHQERLCAMNVELATQLAGQPDSYFDLSDFDSAPDFIERSLAFAIVDGQSVLGVAYSSLVCSRGIEVSIFVEETYRRQGVATTLASKLLLECLKQGLQPNWDAANPESCRLAQKLGFVFVDTYDAFYHTGN
jgi:GNAT superfamily N-acetyltransferase